MHYKKKKNKFHKNFYKYFFFFNNNNYACNKNLEILRIFILLIHFKSINNSICFNSLYELKLEYSKIDL
jgi:hypothetical protein